ncbi:MAG: acyl-CoA thioesterase [Planctomycetota bacterium]|nr:acyl-CoA thioesterase [Planctomycetota bacterium]
MTFDPVPRYTPASSLFLPPTQSSMPAIYELPIQVALEDIDPLGHVNNVTYVQWMQSAALAHSAAQGWPHEAYVQLGAGWVVRSHTIEYLQPAYSGDSVVVVTWVADMKKVTSLRRYRIVRRTLRETGPHEALLATAATDWAFVDFKSRLPRRIAPEVSRSFEIVDPPIS